MNEPSALVDDEGTSEEGQPARSAAPAARSAPGQATNGAPRLTMFELARLEEARRRAAEVDVAVRESARAPHAVRRPSWLLVAALMVVAATAVLRLYGPMTDVAGERRYAREVGEGAEVERAAPTIAAAHPAYGKSGGVLIRVAMPGQLVEYPVSVQTDLTRLAYQWVRASDSSEADAVRPLGGVTVIAPPRPGLYHLSIVPRDAARDAVAGERRVLGDLTLAVLVPFAQKVGGTVNGYRIGSYPFERFGGERPLGFIEIDRRTLSLPVTRHLRLGDFVTHDAQQGKWPKYAAVSPRLLDKIELVVAEAGRMGFARDPSRIEVNVHSGFRTPLHNQGVEGAALNSRHQYGDAADVAIDVDGDGRFTALDSRIVAIATEMVERRNPDLVGGLGVYVSAKYRSPYVHIDARGKKARWWG